MLLMLYEVEYFAVVEEESKARKEKERKINKKWK